MTGLRRRIRALESGLAKRLEQPVRTDQAPGTGPEWLAAFEAMGREGQFEHEPDFPRALAFYREAIRDATAPAYFRHAGQPRPLPEPYRGRSFVRVDAGGNIIPDGVDVNHGVNCRVTSAADEGWQWLAGMALRVQCGIPPVSEAEFQELTDWLTDVLRYTDSRDVFGGRTRRGNRWRGEFPDNALSLVDADAGGGAARLGRRGTGGSRPPTPGALQRRRDAPERVTGSPE